MTVIGLLLAGCSSVSRTACLREHLADPTDEVLIPVKWANEDTVLMTVIPNSSLFEIVCKRENYRPQEYSDQLAKTLTADHWALFLPAGDTLLYQYSFLPDSGAVRWSGLSERRLLREFFDQECGLKGVYCDPPRLNTVATVLFGKGYLLRHIDESGCWVPVSFRTCKPMRPFDTKGHF